MSVIKWFGGKHYLAPKLIELFPTHTHYVEAYAGGLSVLFRKDPEGVSEVVNDLNGELSNFWYVLQDERRFKKFQRIIEATPFSKVEYDEALREEPIGTASPLMTQVSRAVAFFIRYRQSRQGLGKDFATLSRTRVRRGMSEQASSWLTAIDGLQEAHERLQRVVVMNEPAVDLIQQQDDDDTFYYLDPPYLHETRVTTDNYDFEMSPDQHTELLNTLGSIKGKFALSGYRSTLYDSFAFMNDWRRVDIEIDNKASSKKIKPKMTESVWMNYAP